MNSENQGLQLSINFRNETITSNNGKIAQNNKKIESLNNAVKKSKDLKTNIESHSKTSDQLKSEADSILNSVTPVKESESKTPPIK